MTRTGKQQLQFIEWLKDNGLYNETDSDQVMNRMHDVWSKVHEKLIWVHTQNPYPDDIFIQPSDEDMKKMVAWSKETKFPLSGYNGSWSRKVWELCTRQLKDTLE